MHMHARTTVGTHLDSLGRQKESPAQETVGKDPCQRSPLSLVAGLKNCSLSKCPLYLRFNVFLFSEKLAIIDVSPRPKPTLFPAVFFCVGVNHVTQSRVRIYIQIGLQSGAFRAFTLRRTLPYATIDMTYWI